MDWDNPVTYGVLLAILVAIGSFITLIFKIGEWKGEMNALELTVDDPKNTIGEALKEIRSDIKKIFQLLPRDPLSGQSRLAEKDEHNRSGQ